MIAAVAGAVNVTIFPFLYGLHTPLPRDPITCTAALTFSSLHCTIVTRPDSFLSCLLLCLTRTDSQ